MIDVREARRRLEAAVAPLPAETVPLDRALARVLAADVVADRDQPPTDRSAMDGYAVRHADLASPHELDVVGEVAAGADPGTLEIGPGQACRIFTGAVLPRGADAVVMVEKTRAAKDGARVHIDQPPRAGENVRPRGSDRRAGDPVLASGTRIRAAEIAALATVGCVDVPVRRGPRVAVLSTGDELVAAGEVPAAHQLRDSNAPTTRAQLAEAGFEALDLGSARDDPDELERRIARGLDADLLLVSGGVSVGAYDFVEERLRAAGVEILFHGVKMKPGKPILAGRHERGWVLGLPGNPLSAFAGTLLFALPVLRMLDGEGDPWPRERGARLATALRRKPGRETYHLAKLSEGREGTEARPVSSTGSGDVLALALADAFVVTEAGCTGLDAGAKVRAIPF